MPCGERASRRRTWQTSFTQWDSARRTTHDREQKAVVVLRANQTVREAVGVFAEGHIHSLPVVDDHENLVGIVTTTDVLRYMQEQY